jgi:hypothetical protein
VGFTVLEEHIASTCRMKVSKVEKLVGYMRSEKSIVGTDLANHDPRLGRKVGNHLPEDKTVL